MMIAIILAKYFAGFTYIDCYADQVNYEARDLTGLSTTSSSLTIEGCMAYCASAGYTYAGVENGYSIFFILYISWIEIWQMRLLIWQKYV